MKIYALVTARSGSKGVTNKNLQELGGHSLLEWSITSIIKTPEVKSVFLSTDSDKYAKCGESFGAQIPFLRPPELATDTAVDLEVIKHFLNEIKDVPDMLLHIRPTTPLRDPQIISAAINRYISEEPNLTSLRSVHEMSESAYKSFEKSSGGFLKTISTVSDGDQANLPRQLFPKTYQANGYVDILKPSLILDKNKLHGDRILAFETPVVTEVDSLEDLEYLRWQIIKDPGLINLVFNGL